MNKSDLFLVRDGVEDDRPFIFATMLRGLFYGDSWFSEVPKAIFMQEYHGIVERLLDTAEIRVACLKDDPEVILGYALINAPDTVHFVFIKKAFRGIGIAKSLVPLTVTNTTHLTKAGLSIIKRKGIVFNPFFRPRSES